MPSKELNYNLLLLNHLSNISSMSSQIMGDQIMGEGKFIRSTEKQKDTAFNWAVNILAAIIPDEIRDNDFDEKINKLKEDNKERDVKFNIDFLQILINLLARKGYLVERTLIADFVRNERKREGKIIPKEVFEK